MASHLLSTGPLFAWKSGAAGEVLGADLGHGSLYELLASRCDITVTGATEQARAVTCSASDRSLLRLGRGEGVLEVERVGVPRNRSGGAAAQPVRGSAYIVEVPLGDRPGAPDLTATTERLLRSPSCLLIVVTAD